MMIIITTRRKVLKIAVIAVMIGTLVISVYGYMQHKSSEIELGLLTNNRGVTDKISLTAFLISEDATAQANKIIEIFDVKKGKVIKRIDSTETIQSEVKGYLEGITGLYVKVKAFPDNGFIVRVPLYPPVKIQNQWVDGLVEETFIIFPENETPYLLMLDNRARPYFYNFKGNTDKFLKTLDLQLTTPQE